MSFLSDLRYLDFKMSFSSTHPKPQKWINTGVGGEGKGYVKHLANIMNIHISLFQTLIHSYSSPSVYWRDSWAFTLCIHIPSPILTLVNLLDSIIQGHKCSPGCGAALNFFLLIGDHITQSLMRNNAKESRENRNLAEK